MKFNKKNGLRILVAVLLLTGGLMSIAYFAEDKDKSVPVANVLWQTECGSCHVAFPPHLLPAESWRAVMSGLKKHFGTDANLDPAVSRKIYIFLQEYAGAKKYEASPNPLLRITETQWFQQVHSVVSERTWKRPKIRSAANCVACHIQAESGNYNGHDIIIPK